MLHVSVFLQYTLISGIDSFHSLPSSIRVAFLGHTILGMIAHGNDKGRNTVIRDAITIDTVVTELS